MSIYRSIALILVFCVAKCLSYNCYSASICCIEPIAVPENKIFSLPDLGDFKLTDESLYIISLELNICFSGSTSLQFVIPGKGSLSIHLSDSHASHDLATPTYHIVLVNETGKFLDYYYELNEQRTSFFAIRFFHDRIEIGDRYLDKTLDIPVKNIRGIEFSANGKPTILRSIVQTQEPPGAIHCDIEQIPNLIEQIRNSTISEEGIWTLADEHIDLDYARSGGKYTLATVLESNQLKIVYVEGAEINPEQWKSGMIKGCASPTDIDDVWDVVWVDSTFLKDAKRVYLKFEGDIMSVYFPYDYSNLTFVRKR